MIIWPPVRIGAAVFRTLTKDNEQTHQNSHDGRKSRDLAVMHQDGLGEDLAEHHIQHGATGKAQTQCQSQCADLADQIAQQCAHDGGNAGKCGHENRLGLAHSAADEGHGNRHALGNVVQTDQHRKHQRRTAHHAAAAGIGSANGHTLRNIVQGNGAGHHYTGNEQRKFVIMLDKMLLIVIAVDQFIQIIRSFGMVFVNVRNLRIGLSVDPIVEQINQQYTKRNLARILEHALADNLLLHVKMLQELVKRLQ